MRYVTHARGSQKTLKTTAKLHRTHKLVLQNSFIHSLLNFKYEQFKQKWLNSVFAIKHFIWSLFFLKKKTQNAEVTAALQ